MTELHNSYHIEAENSPNLPDKIEGDAYAWGKTARVLTEQQLLQAMDDTTGPFFALDICSSLPYYRQIMEGQYKQQLRDGTTKLIGSFIDQGVFKKPGANGLLPSLASADSEQLKLFRKTMGQQKGDCRRQLHTAVFDLQFDSSELAKISYEDEQEEVIRKRLLDQMHNSTSIQAAFTEPSGKAGEKGNWTYITNVDSQTTLFQKVNDMFPQEIAEEILGDIANYFARKLKGQLRPVTFVSLDKIPLDKLVQDAIKCFPKKIHDTRFFKSTASRDRHIMGDINNLPVKEDSVSFIANIEGFPFYFGSMDLSQKESVAKQQADALKPGGKAVFFPWEVKRGDFDSPNSIAQQAKDLQALEDFWAKNGYIVEKRGFTKNELLANMSDRELLLTDHSPVFKKGDGILTVLTLTKPQLAA